VFDYSLFALLVRFLFVNCGPEVVVDP